jgi:hypothetical protein
MMHRWLLGLSVAMVAPLGFPAWAQESVPQIPFESVPNFLKLPADMHLGEAAGVAVNSKGHVFVYSRSGTGLGPAYGNAASQLLEFGPDGKYLREIGKNLYAWSFAHTVRIDKDDNIWATDKGSDMIIKFNDKDGKVMMVFGRKSESSDSDAHPLEHPKPPLPAVDGRFRQPTDVTWDPQGNLYIADGYINSRVAKYDKNGKWVKQWGGWLRTRPVQHRALDRFRCQGQHLHRRPYQPAASRCSTARAPPEHVQDRRAVRCQREDGDRQQARSQQYQQTGGTFAGRTVGALHHPAPNQVLYAADAYPGRVYKLTLDGKVLGVLGESGRQLKQFGWVHEIACPSENVLFVAEIITWRVQKLLLHPEMKKSASR